MKLLSRAWTNRVQEITKPISFVRLVLSRGLCSNRTSGRPGVAVEVPDSWDKDWFAARSAHRARDVCHGGPLNVVFLDLA